jgi:hypothetical protein
VQDVIDHLGFMQVDSVNTGACHLILWSRRQQYRTPGCLHKRTKVRMFVDGKIPCSGTVWRHKFAKDKAHMDEIAPRGGLDQFSQTSTGCCQNHPRGPLHPWMLVQTKNADQVAVVGWRNLHWVYLWRSGDFMP